MSCELKHFKAIDNIKEYIFEDLKIVDPQNFSIVTSTEYPTEDAVLDKLRRIKESTNRMYDVNKEYFNIEKNVPVSKGDAYNKSSFRTDTKHYKTKVRFFGKDFEEIDELRKSLNIYDNKKPISVHLEEQKKNKVITIDKRLFSKEIHYNNFVDVTGEIVVTKDMNNPLRDKNIERFFDNNNETTVLDVLDYIAKESPSAKALALHLKSKVFFNIKIELANLDFLIGYQNGKSLKAAGMYVPKTTGGQEKIIIAKGAAHQKQNATSTILHEIVHALSFNLLEDRYFVKTKEKEAFVNAYDHAVNEFKKLKENGYTPFSEHFDYRMSDYHEFLTGLLTDSQFVRDLQNIPVSSELKAKTEGWKNFLEEIIDKLLNLLKITKKDTFYNQAAMIASNVLEAQYQSELDFESLSKNQFDQEMNDYFSGQNKFEQEQDDTKTKKQVKKGVQELFNENPELNAIGTPEQYSQYLDTIFPDSKVKDIVYHSTPFEFDSFKKPFEVKENIFNQSLIDDRNPEKIIPDAIFFQFEPKTFRKGRIIPAIINSKELIKKENYSGYSIHYSVGNRQQLEKQLNSKTFDALDITPINHKRELLVFEPEQIHILGSKEDVDGFKKFVQSDLSNLELYLQNLELNKEVIDYLYSISSKRFSKDTYEKEAHKLVNNLRGMFSNEEIVEKLKCL